MLALLLSLAIAQTAPSGDHAPLINQKLPFNPVRHSEMLVTGGGSDGLGFDVLPSIDRAFDPNKEMPELQESSKAQRQLAWETTPAHYIVTNDILLRLTGNHESQPRYHELQVVRYSEQEPWATIDHLGIIFFDHKAFAMCVSDYSDDGRMIDRSNASLVKGPDGTTRLNIGQFMSGTGAANSLSVFEITSEGPKLIEFREGGRDH